ncbi:MAG: iron transporter [Nitrospinaceae bacterium]|nr:MAG: iron transporter [Nitrospinaceae bacterium]
MNENLEKSFEVLDTEMTPNPNAFKYIMNAPVIAAGAKSITSEEDAPGDNFIRAVFALGNVQSIYLSENFVTVSFLPSHNLDVLVEAVEDIIEEYLTFYDGQDPKTVEKDESSILENLDKIDFPNLSDPEKAEIIDALFDETVRPALANDGGGVTVLDFEDNTLKIRYQGACGSCPSSATGTLRAIENILRSYLKQEIQVITTSL